MWVLLIIHFHLVNNAIAIDHIDGFTSEASCLEMSEKIQDKLEETDGIKKELTLMCLEKK